MRAERKCYRLEGEESTFCGRVGPDWDATADARSATCVQCLAELERVTQLKRDRAAAYRFEERRARSLAAQARELTLGEDTTSGYVADAERFAALASRLEAAR